MSKKATPAKKPTKTAKKATASKSKAVKNGLKQVNLVEFEKALLKGKRGYVKKARSWKKTHVWWDDPKDPWFMHWAEDKRSGKNMIQEKIGLLTAKDMSRYYERWSREGYGFYLEA